MSKEWNGAQLVTDLSTSLSDTSTSFKALVLGWINDTILDIYTRNDWSFAIRKGKKTLTASQETQQLNLSKPIACTLAQSATAGTITDASVYKVLITFYESFAGVESIAGEESNAITISGASKSLALTAIPLSLDPLVTSRKVYLSKDGADFLYYGTIANNVDTTYSIIANATSTITAPDVNNILELYGNPFIESYNQLKYETIDQLRLAYSGTWTSGTPEFWTNLGEEGSVSLYPIPSSAIVLSFYYKKMPSTLLNLASSVPDLPYKLKDVLEAGVMAKGYDYRDRDGKQERKDDYEEAIEEKISSYSFSQKVVKRVRDTDFGGYEV